MKSWRIFITSFSIIISLIVGIVFSYNGYHKFLIVRSSTSDHSISFDLNTRLNIGIAYIILNIIYVIWILINESPKPQNKKVIFTYNLIGNQFIDIVKNATLFLIIAFLTYPSFGDIYLYLQYGLMGINGINPFLEQSGNFPSELSNFITWNQSSTYPPFSQALFMLAANFLQVHPILAIYIFKLICLAAHLFNGYLIWYLLKDSKHRRKITFAYLINPLLLFEQVSLAHIDVFVCTTLLIFIVCFKYQRYVLGLFMIWVGFLIKILPILWLPLSIVFLCRRKQLHLIAIATTIILISLTILEHTILTNISAWYSLFNPGVMGKSANSLHTLFQFLLNNFHNLETALKQTILLWFHYITTGGFFIYYAIAIFKLSFGKAKSADNLFLEIGWVTLLLFLFATPWLMPWYASILIPIMALQSDSQRFIVVSMIFCFANSYCYALINTGIIQSIVITGLPILILMIFLMFDFCKIIIASPLFKK